MNRIIRVISGVVLSAAVLVPALARAPLTFRERVQAETAIQRVYYSHRLWPKANEAPKPAFEDAVPESLIEAKVTDYLKKSAALAALWKHPITPNQLQAEMDRMEKGSKDPALLAELFSALGNDPYVIAECLARPALADREIRSWYAYDARYQAKTKKRAEAALRDARLYGFDAVIDGTESYLRYIAGPDVQQKCTAAEDGGGGPVPVAVSVDELKRLKRTMPSEGAISGLSETAYAYAFYRTVKATDGSLEIEARVFQKKSFNVWWNEEKASLMADIPLLDHPYHFAKIHAQAAAGSTCLGKWEATSMGAIPSARIGHTAVWTGAEMIVWGGNGNSGGRYFPATDTWEATSTGSLCPSGRQNHTAVWTGSEMIVWGGDDFAGNALSDGGRYNPTTNTWAPMSQGPSCPAARYGHEAVWTGTEMIVWGGQYRSGAGRVQVNTGGLYDPVTDSWTSMSTGAGCPAGRIDFTAVWTGSEMIVWGGYSNTSMGYASGGRYDPTTDTWQPTSEGGSCPAGRYRHTAVWTGTEMIVWGGVVYPGEVTNTGGRYNPVTDTWIASSTAGSCPNPREQHTAMWTGSRMIVWGGNDVSGGSVIHFNTGGQFDPVSDTWTPTSTGGDCPTVRSLQTVVWTGTEMIVWGGINNSGGLNSGGRYNPLTDTWVSTSTGSGVPNARYRHTGVWTGTQMIVWGGWVPAEFGPSNTGSRYTPATDSWSATSTAPDCPSGRWTHTAVWTGTRMIVWGGLSPAHSALNTGGLYDPLSDTWQATSTVANVPAVRYGHTAVWTGFEMIVWGGQTSGGSGYLNSGGCYDPLTDSWRSTSTTAPCPAERSFLTAVWTGTEMIVWGGFNSGGYLNSGGRYDPAADTWAATSTGVNCPTGREYPAAVWTGTVMVVWGGLGNTFDPDGQYKNTGGRYNPVSDTWLPTSTAWPCPTGRISMPGVWTGSEMIIWSGYDWSGGGNEDATGGRYDPVTDTWRPTAIAGNCPSRRFDFASVWTGSQMIVWGGSASEAGIPGDGGIYTVTGPAEAPPSGIATPAATDTDPCALGVELQWQMDAGNWSDGGSGEYRYYQVYRNGSPLASGGCGGSFPYGSTGCSDTATTANTTYYYQVKYVNACGEATLSPATVLTDDVLPVPSSVYGPFPSYGATEVSLTPSLSWAASTGATSYDVYFGTSPSPPLVTATAGTSYTPGVLDVNTVYYWRIVPSNVCHEGSTSPTWSFTTECPSPTAAVDPVPANGLPTAPVTSTLAWSAVEGAGTYDVYFGTASSPPMAGTVTAPGFNPGTLAPDTTYYWKVVPRNICGTATGCLVWSFHTCPLTPPAASPVPEDGGSSTLLRSVLSWGAVASAVSYDVYFGTAANPPMAGTVTTPSFTPGVLTPSTTYYWKVVPKSTCGPAENVPTWSFTTCSLPAAAGAPSPGDGSTGVLTGSTLTWTHVEAAQSYEVYFGTSPDPQKAGTVTAAAFSPGTLAHGTTYYWKVVPVSTCGAAENVPTWSFTTCSLPAAASGPNPGDGSVGIMIGSQLTWSAVEGATSYDVYLGTTAEPSLVGSVSVPAYSPGQLAPETTYYWKVVPKSACGSAEAALTWSFTTCTLPPPTANPSPADGLTTASMRPVLTWSPVIGVENYDVYLGTSSDPPLVATVQGASYSPGALDGSTTYYWRIVPRTACGPAAGVPTWSFETVPAPVISYVTKAGSPFRLKIIGSGFESGAIVKIDGQPVPQTKYKNASKLVAKKGHALKDMVPQGTSVCITVENPDGGFCNCYTYAR